MYIDILKDIYMHVSINSFAYYSGLLTKYIFVS